ncbi:hypothetical protein I603_1009 [Erythrobacter dokdonensis DSW-74]|uniref:Uncharacterized protein n=1 Tax=Erythrobacter dokdonensis DSW-74 TaxID=1300349 RepID=A0A1A7BIM7_9SPHN|nr:hypothetical protein I603_1009 [Erythrobacter dokdonensis DSW-74]
MHFFPMSDRRLRVEKLSFAQVETVQIAPRIHNSELFKLFARKGDWKNPKLEI